MANHAKCCVPVNDVLIEGGRTGLLLVHRLGGSPADLGSVAAALGQDGYTVSCPVLFGHCGSPDLLAATTWSHWYASVQQAHDELAKRCDSVVVGGLGVGALLALHLAAERPADVHGLTLMSPTFWPDGWAMPWTSRILRVVEQKWLANFIRFDDRLPYGIKDDAMRRAMIDQIGQDGRTKDDVNTLRGGVLLEVKWLAKIVTAELARITQPCLVFHPRHDDRSSLATSQILQKRLGGIVDLVVLEDSYHRVTQDRQQGVVTSRMLDFAAALPRLMKQRPQRPVPTISPGQ